jgi:single-stranded DNA-binding protein
MPQLNRFELIGFLASDPVFETRRNTPMFRFSLAVNGSRYDTENRVQVAATRYFNSLSAWGQLAVECNRMGLRKGSLVFVSGYIDVDPYTEKFIRPGQQAPVTRNILTLKIANIQFLSTNVAAGTGSEDPAPY